MSLYEISFPPEPEGPVWDRHGTKYTRLTLPSGAFTWMNSDGCTELWETLLLRLGPVCDNEHGPGEA